MPKRSLFTDIQQIIHEPSAENRKKLTEQITAMYKEGDFSSSEEIIFFEIFQLLAKDVDKKVRATLSDNIKLCEEIPHDIAITLANDDIDVAEPILLFSKVLTDDDLVEIINLSKEVSHLITISKRNDVSESVSKALVDSEYDKVIESLVENKTAKIDDDTFKQIVVKHKNSENIIKKISHRDDINDKIFEEIKSHIPIELQDKLFLDKNISASLANRIISQKNIGFSDEDEIKKAEEKIKALEAKKQLNNKVILESLITGYIILFEVALVHLTREPIVKIRTALHNSKSPDFIDVLEKAQFDQDLIHSIEIIVDYIYTEINNNKRRGVYKSNQEVLKDLLNRFKRFSNEMEIVKKYINS